MELGVTPLRFLTIEADVCEITLVTSTRIAVAKIPRCQDATRQSWPRLKHYK